VLVTDCQTATELPLRSGSRFNHQFVRILFRYPGQEGRVLLVAAQPTQERHGEASDGMKIRLRADGEERASAIGPRAEYLLSPVNEVVEVATGKRGILLDGRCRRVRVAAG